jgi:hypothetical protein
MGDGVLDKFPCIQDQTSPNLAHIPTTNLVTQSNNLTTSWGNYNFTGGLITEQFGVLSPEGLNNASRITYTNSSAGTGGGLLTENITVLANTVYTISFYAKSISGVKQFRVDLKNSGSQGANGSLFTITNEWKRYSVTVENSNGTSRGVQIRILETEISGNRTFDVWGFQLEEQSQATATLPSNGVAAVRKATTTNLIPYSEDFSTYDQIQNITLIPNATTSPTGTSNATKVLSTANNSKVRDNISVVNGTTYTFSIYCKNIDATMIKLLAFDGVTEYQSALTSQVSTTQWARISITFTSGSTGTGQVQFARDMPNGESAFFWGAQFEEQTQAETYAPTKGIPVTIDLFKENNYGTMTNMVAGNIVLDTPNKPA